jgi:hypothetical protein
MLGQTFLQQVQWVLGRSSCRSLLKRISPFLSRFDHFLHAPISFSFQHCESEVFDQYCIFELLLSYNDYLSTIASSPSKLKVADFVQASTSQFGSRLSHHSASLSLPSPRLPRWYLPLLLALLPLCFLQILHTFPLRQRSPTPGRHANSDQHAASHTHFLTQSTPIP